MAGRPRCKALMGKAGGASTWIQPALEQILALRLSTDEKQAILADNARRIYGI